MVWQGDVISKREVKNINRQYLPLLVVLNIEGPRRPWKLTSKNLPVVRAATV